MKHNKKLEQDLLNNIHKRIDKLINECHHPDCETRKHPMTCCPQFCDIVSLQKYTIALGAKVTLKLIPSADGFPYYWPQVLWQLRLMSLELAGGKNLNSPRMTDMKVLFFDLIDFAKLYANDSIKSELSGIRRTFSKVLDI